jgi:hypothetical protein
MNTELFICRVAYAGYDVSWFQDWQEVSPRLLTDDDPYLFPY